MSLRGFFADLVIGAVGGPRILRGSASPESSVTAPVGSLYLRTTAGAGTVLYVKESGTSSTGWVAMASASALTSGLVRVATITLTDAQIKALPTTPQTIIAAPGAGSYNNVLSYALNLNTVAGAYTNINTTYSTLQIETANGNWLGPVIVNDDTTTPDVTRLTGFLGAAHSAFVRGPGAFLEAPGEPSGWIVPASPTQTTDYDNDLVRIAIDNNGSGALTGGNAANSLKITVTYTVELT